ncbi:alpha-E domain-containing protein [Mangrovimonas sp. YM274]|uniref:alpha-E domain-containing protein n=1 Tax=Mangrovimonas sp. YM274 TaxID=3070660 RepID=UPI0027DAC6A0|nr:alpha-E domain-containing protein [Mangrovimonas sp. YM274]WMI67201.1 alpha-E domain-containing protein [Mangrovimonas sp. YM274]
MLARVANNLFWMGRYIERAEHTARYMNVNYFSSLDAPNKLSQSRQFVLHSIASMVGDAPHTETNLSEEDIIYNVGLNPEKSYSIFNCIKFARENANTSRDSMSTEFYESINKFYHYMKDYSQEVLIKSGLHDFTTHVTEQTSILRGRIRSTLLHDEVYALVLLGINIERATQIIRIIKTKYEDAQKALGGYTKPIENSFEWTTLLKCCESYDMNRRFYKKTPNQSSTLEFLLLNPNCPRSVMNSLNQIRHHITTIDAIKVRDKTSAAFLIGKLRADYEFKTIEEIETDVAQFIENTLQGLTEISTKLNDEYFNY